MKAAVVCKLLALGLALSTVSAHKYGAGKCANVHPMEDFDADRVTGFWYVHQAMGTTSDCLVFNYTRTASGLQVVETKELRLLDAIGLDHKYSSVGNLQENGQPGLYQASFSTNPLTSKYVFMTTDYVNYAGVFHCQHIKRLAHRRNVYILSRTPAIEPIYAEKVLRRMQMFDLEPEHLRAVTHDECTNKEESDINIRLDGTLLDFSGGQ